MTAVRHKNRYLRKEKPMIKVVARTLVREECIESYHELAREIVEETKNDRGMITYTMNQSTTEARIRKYTGVFASPRARITDAVLLYRKVTGMPRKMMKM